MSFLGLDLGTSGIRAVLLDDGGAVLGDAEARYETQHLQDGWSEQDPSSWIIGLEKVVEALRGSQPEFQNLRGIGVAGHMHGATLLDIENNVLRPCILWNDTRSSAQAKEMNENPLYQRISGNIVFPGFTAPKLAWVHNHEPELFSKVSKVLLPAAYLNFYLTGEHVADMSDSAGTVWFDLENRAWSEALLDQSGMEPQQMPRLVEGSSKAGSLRPEIAAAWGVSGEVIVAGGAGDNAAAACGMGVLNEGQGFVSLGTSGVVLLARDQMRAAPETALHTFCHAVPDRWYQMSVMLSAADSLSWLSNITGRTPAEMTNALGETLQAPGSVSFAPYLSGERTPHNDAFVRGGFSGLSAGTTVTDLTHAVLEGVCFGLRDGLEAMRETGAKFEGLYAVGGGSQSRYWLQMLSTILNTALYLPKGGEFGAAMGAARLGMVAATGASVEDVMQVPDVEEVLQPTSELVGAYDDAYQRFQRLYPAFKSLV
ncbi:xylulokinase [Sulfitobacter donghicola]|uniref:Xylulose kinase n=1 Tax=Sulfitobacter donghicola DSW-25 = KCTC 12864 = JCM 14565 TaxID=1300350 RepID=A0A073IKD3_9RHOB|nr:xylulokinase [Sulfitobacter donghicola]KEJ90793.1 xylulokinase [Sulfitobacter donghicola DSW-25 = KCTC 12864 = JCM 14565]KIN68066.1 Xylulokinase [Sulfitobacter donghicola DSW-25 = KCTC 12864 = JCM 14565]